MGFEATVLRGPAISAPVAGWVHAGCGREEIPGEGAGLCFGRPGAGPEINFLTSTQETQCRGWWGGKQSGVR